MVNFVFCVFFQIVFAHCVCGSWGGGQGMSGPGRNGASVLGDIKIDALFVGIQTRN